MGTKSKTKNRKPRQAAMTTPVNHPPTPEIVLDHDDGDPPSSREIANTLSASMAAVRTPPANQSSSLTPLPPGYAVSDPLRSASWTPPAASTPLLAPSANRFSVVSSSLPSGTALQSPAQITGSIQHSAGIRKNTTTGSQTGSKNNGSHRKATVEEVDDVDDSPSVKAARALKKKLENSGEPTVSTRSHPSSRSRKATEPMGSARQPSTLPISPSFLPSRSLETVSPVVNGTRHDVSYPASPYAAASILNEYDRSEMGDEARAKRRDDKRRALLKTISRGSSLAAEIPLPPSDVRASESEFEARSLTSRTARRLRDEALAHERAIHDDTSEGRRRRDDRISGLKRLKELRIQQDEEYARELQSIMAAEATQNDLQIAENLQRQQYEEDTQSILRSQQDAAEDEEKARVAEEIARATREAAHARRIELELKRKERDAQYEAEQERVRKEEELSVPLPLKDRIILQRWRETDLKQRGTTRYRDQGIGWDANGAPIEIGPAPTKRSSIDPEEKPVVGRKVSASKPAAVTDVDEVARPVKKPARPSSRDENKSEKKEKSSRKIETPQQPKKAAAQTVKTSPKDEGTDFYLKSGTAPKKPEPSDGGDSSSASDSSESDSSSGSDSDSDESRLSRGTYRRESTYSRSESTDSALESDSDDSRKKKKKKKNKKRRKGRDDSKPTSKREDSSKDKDSPRMATGYRDTTKRYRFVKREPLQNEPRNRDFRPDSARIIPKDAPRHGGRDGGGYQGNNPRPYPKPSQGARPPVPQAGSSKKAPVCYKCGGPHYQNECTHNKPRAPIMYHGREIVDDNEEEEHRTHPPIDRPTTESSVEHLKQMADEDGEVDDEHVDGDQYDSEYTLEECSNYSEYENDEQCYHLVDDDDLPCLMEVTDDSDIDSESEYDGSVGDWSEADSVKPEHDESVPVLPPKQFNKPKPKRRELTLEELGLFGVCDDYSDDEFVAESDVDGLAKEMAECLMATGDPETRARG
ncbi:hypothetical protein R3P38DRAFT_2770581 [Favolaschia claudopus]|uniref:CCHC-type domain-containing protein n=1 Tax=Favolaschia claudopus TaxID=2862362 RepID=A0AAW0CH64_9AGAR